jgi:DNA invertase Pin-like site-specific DNA recombinase
MAENVDTPARSGKLVVNGFGTLAEFDRSRLRERTTAA